MYADPIDFRVFQSAAQQAKRLGIPPREAVRQVAEARREGMTGQHVAGQLQHRAIRAAWPKFDGAA